MIPAKEGARTIYIDMDGVLAEFHWDATPDQFSKGQYYEDLKPNRDLITAILNLIKRGFHVVVCSKVINKDCERGKDKWLDAQGLGSIERIYVPNNESKADYIPDEEHSICLDDYTANLLGDGRDIQRYKGIPCKFYNGINGRFGRYPRNLPSLRSTVGSKAMEFYLSWLAETDKKF